MTIPPMEDLNFTSHERRFGSDTFARGQRYFDEGRVGRVEWNEQASTVSSTVRGNRVTPYSTSVALALDRGRIVSVDYGQCNCPVVFNCKHVVAVLLQAHQDSRLSSECSLHRADEHWATALAPLLQDEPTVKGSTRFGRTNVGLRLQLEMPDESNGFVRLWARPVIAQSSGGWSTTGISWSTLPYSIESAVEHRVDVLRELHALHRTRSHGRAAHSFYSTRSDSIDLAEISGRLLWDLLADAREYDLPLFGDHGDNNPMPWPTDAHFEIDITGFDDLEVEGRISVDGCVVPADRRRFLGRDGGGIVYWSADSSSAGSFRLARLTKPVPQGMRRVASSTIAVPGPDRLAFTTSYLPVLERGSAIVSSDGSFTQPVIAGPEIHILVVHDGHGRLDVSARWRYFVDDIELDFEADAAGVDAAVRDATAELTLLRTVESLLGRHTQPTIAFPPFAVTGTTAARFVAERLPLLEGYDNVHVDVRGDLPDFRDVGDDVGISVSTRSIRGENDWFDLEVVLRIEGTLVEFATVITALASGDRYLLLPDGRYFSLDRSEFQTLRILVEEAQSLQDKPDGPLRISRFQASLWEDLAEIGEVSSQARTWREQVAALTSLGSVPTHTPPEQFRAELRPYQVDGFNWLYFLWSHRLGGILADDMGLGKTVQTLAMIAKAKETGSSPSPFLIVAPTSVVHNWAREAAQFAPGLTVVTALGTRVRRRSSIAELAAEADIVVTSYTVFRLDFADCDDTEWSGLVLDEAQYVKNHKSKAYHCARRLAAPFKLAITGTPMENNVMELWALLSITAPGLFPSAGRFTKSYRIPIERSGSAEALATLRRRIKPVVLRRTKDVVAQDLPAKQEQVVEIRLDPRHRRIYDTRLARERQKILGLLHDFERNRVMILRSLTILRQLSLDVSLVEDGHDDVPSAKIDALVLQLTEIIAGGHRALVFSQFTTFLGKVRDRLEAEGISLSHLDGSTRNRGEAVELFRSGGKSVFLISLKAGGVGLTLTEADYCFVLDPWWNPATEAQAVDRAHRIGQSRTVFVHRYIASGTIEEKVMELKERKAALFSSVMDDGEIFSGSITAEDIRSLFQ